MTQDIQIITAPEIITTGAPHYPTSCLIFVKSSMRLDEMAQQFLVNSSFSTMPGSKEADAAGKMMLRHLGSLVSDVAYPVKLTSWATLAKAVPAAPVKKFCKGRIHSLSEEFADRRATYLSGLLPASVVATALPPSLRTEDAVSYMHHNRRYGLKSVIEIALDMTR